MGNLIEGKFITKSEKMIEVKVEEEKFFNNYLNPIISNSP